MELLHTCLLKEWFLEQYISRLQGILNNLTTHDRDKEKFMLRLLIAQAEGEIKELKNTSK